MKKITDFYSFCFEHQPEWVKHIITKDGEKISISDITGCYTDLDGEYLIVKNERVWIGFHDFVEVILTD